MVIGPPGAGKTPVLHHWIDFYLRNNRPVVLLAFDDSPSNLRGPLGGYTQQKLPEYESMASALNRDLLCEVGRLTTKVPVLELPPPGELSLQERTMLDNTDRTNANLSDFKGHLLRRLSAVVRSRASFALHKTNAIYSKVKFSGGCAYPSPAPARA